MKIIQRLNLNMQLTGNNQLVVSDYTGIYSAGNPTGYGGANGNPITDILKYRFILTYLSDDTVYTQIQSDDVNNPNERTTPSVIEIANQTPVEIKSDYFSELPFKDGLYKLQMMAEMNYAYNGDGFEGVDTVVNLAGAQLLYDNYNYILGGGKVYKILAVEGSNLTLDKPIVTEFHTLTPLIGSSTNLLLFDSLNDCLNNKVAEYANNCDCNMTPASLNSISEIQLYLWGMERSLEINDIIQANEFLEMANKLCKSLNCGCNGCK